MFRSISLHHFIVAIKYFGIFSFIIFHLNLINRFHYVNLVNVKVFHLGEYNKVIRVTLPFVGDHCAYLVVFPTWECDNLYYLIRMCVPDFHQAVIASRSEELITVSDELRKASNLSWMSVLYQKGLFTCEKVPKLYHSWLVIIAKTAN
jgi:hypothetical protein